MSLGPATRNRIARHYEPRLRRLGRRRVSVGLILTGVLVVIAVMAWFGK